MKEETRVAPGDVVRHRPTGETWVVRAVQGEYLSWYGYPPGRARVADCDALPDPAQYAALLFARAGTLTHRGVTYALTWDGGGV